MTATTEGVERRQFSIKVLGKTLEHLGVQMYKRRDAAIAELVANCWDAGAENVEIVLPAEASYNRDTSVLTITDDGGGTGLRRSRGCVMLPGCAVCRGIAQPTGAAGVDTTWQTCWVASSWW
jgi:Histidine kinase-, DNA gyrase B-, and HSP90-like ATPase